MSQSERNEDTEKENERVCVCERERERERAAKTRDLLEWVFFGKGFIHSFRSFSP